MKHLIHALDGLAHEFKNDPFALADIARLRALVEAGSIRAGEPAEQELAADAQGALSDLAKHFALNTHAMLRVNRLAALLGKLPEAVPPVPTQPTEPVDPPEPEPEPEQPTLPGPVLVPPCEPEPTSDPVPPGPPTEAPVEPPCEEPKPAAPTDDPVPPGPPTENTGN